MWIEKLIEKHGIDNILVEAPTHPVQNMFGIRYQNVSEPPVSQFCRIGEHRFGKVLLVPIDPKFGKNRWYLCDLEQAAGEKKVKIFILKLCC
jgi:hypothetical protein